MDTPLAFVSHGGRIAGWFARLAAWFDWGGTGGWPAPTPACDHGSGADPSGTPCTP